MDKPDFAYCRTELAKIVGQLTAVRIVMKGVSEKIPQPCGGYTIQSTGSPNGAYEASLAIDHAQRAIQFLEDDQQQQEPSHDR